MHPVLLFAAVLAAAPYLKPLPGGLASIALGVEYLPLPAAKGLVVRHDALLGAVEIDAADPAALLRYLDQHESSLCPKAELRPGGVRLRCTSRQLTVALTYEKKAPTLQLTRLRGLPMARCEDGPPFSFYDPGKFGSGPCPGRTLTARAECALNQGRRAEAAKLFKEGFATDPSWAALRLGDLAIETGEPNLAVSWYQRARRQGVFGRLAIARECEVTGDCFHRLQPVFDATGLPEPARTELELRGVRTRMLVGKTTQAVQVLTRRLQETGRVPACELASGLCRRVTLAALRDPGPDGPGAAIALYLALPDREHGLYAAELAHAVAEASTSMGAPLFGAHVLAVTSKEAKPADLDAHLRRTAELFLDGGDNVRAAVVADYARTRLTSRQQRGAGWRAVFAVLEPSTKRNERKISLQEQTASELAQVEQVLAAARRLRNLEE